MQVIMTLQTLHSLQPGNLDHYANKDLVLDGVKATVSSINSDAVMVIIKLTNGFH